MSKKEKKTVGVKVYTQERYKRIWDALFYSHQRLDTLLIAISGAGIYVCLETIKFYENKSIGTHIIIKISAFILLFAVIFNFFSQWVSSKIHSHDYSIATIDFTCEEDGINKNDHKTEIDKLECKIKVLEKIHNAITFLALLFMSIGLTGIVIYFTFIF